MVIFKYYLSMCQFFNNLFRIQINRIKRGNKLRSHAGRICLRCLRKAEWASCAAASWQFSAPCGTYSARSLPGAPGRAAARLYFSRSLAGMNRRPGSCCESAKGAKKCEPRWPSTSVTMAEAAPRGLRVPLSRRAWTMPSAPPP